MSYKKKELKDQIAFGRRIQLARKEQSISSEYLAELCDIESSFLRHIENALRLPSLPTFVDICNRLKVSPDSILVDNIVYSEAEKLENLNARLKTLTPKQFEFVYNVYISILDNLGDDSL